ncbi:hypothetical protein BV22DRAFT_1053255 [Leucogyrophana mollusca]|uniref:Uncharacterized protein n=1 Tax=Leucogyrophana mollusca TaxID=85980 RepID=A0ACB8C0Q9_9AGAM|nr:hypothetical protein BV22DRAFT_1053255 [Leucogyrophana mollusca]
MSRIDSHELNHPSGVGYTHSGTTDRDHPNAYGHSLSASPNHSGPLDRRVPYGMGSFNPHSSHSAIPRSIGMQEKEYDFGMVDAWSAAPNRHTSAVANSQLQHPSSFNHHRPSPPFSSNNGPAVNPTYYNTSSDAERETYFYRHALQSTTSNQFISSSVPAQPANNNTILNTLRSTLWWGELEPWMDEEYAKQVCGLMGWDPVNIKIPSPVTDVTGQQANNPGYCFLTFPSPSVAASVLGQVNNSSSSSQPATMPNSTKPFVLKWASSIPSAPMAPPFLPAGVIVPNAQQQYPKEYSIFVGDLAPETSNSDLVAVFRNPVLGLRNDREPKFIRPFLSCKSAKIMLDPVTGISRGYGFVRFTEEADQQRALIEMHGLYCLSRPMRISPATAKFKPPPVPLDLPQIQFPSSPTGPEQNPNSVTVAIPMPNSNQARSVSAPIAGVATSGSSPSPSSSTTVAASGSGTSLTGSGSVPSLSSGSSASMSSSTLATASSDDMLHLPPDVLAQMAQHYLNSNTSGKGGGNGAASSITSGFAQEVQEQSGGPRYMISEESWKHHAQARAILGNLIGPNGEQLTSTDPYNTTVFVGGLSPLISEETLRTFFAPFGDIHYVKVPVGKHCGFVQFVRKADAERAIEKMQGFPIGGSRIRLSWGRSQYKAAQAAAQAAQAVALQTQFQPRPVAPTVSQMSPEQALQILQTLGVGNFTGQRSNGSDSPSGGVQADGNGATEEKLRSLFMNQSLPDGLNSQQLFDLYSGAMAARPHSNASPADQHQGVPPTIPSFSPFSPDPASTNVYGPDRRRGSDGFPQSDFLSNQNKSYASRYEPYSLDAKASNGTSSDRPAAPARTPSGSQRYGAFLDSSVRSFEASRAPARREPISRPDSGQTSSHGRSSQYDPLEEHDPIHDLNGTLASLDLDHHSPWRSSAGGLERRLKPTSSS